MRPVILVVMDGFGMGPPGPGNAIQLANPVNFNSYLHSYPSTTLKASGEAVGLPAGEVGNTEVGHINLGAGRIVYQDLPRINMSIADGSFYKNPAFLKALQHLTNTGGKLHLLGLVGQGTVHSSIDHLHALIYFAREHGLSEVYLHAITDGRDSPPKSAVEIVGQLEEKLKITSTCRIASIMGRYYGMDRDRRWDRTEIAYKCLVNGSQFTANSATEVINNAYASGKTDEFIEPTNVLKDGKPILIEDGDAVIFFNFRIDRPRQLTKAFVLDDFEGQANISSSYDPYEVKYHKSHLHTETDQKYPIFQRGAKIPNLLFVTMTEYEKDLPVEIAFPQLVVGMPLGRVIAEHAVPQLRMSESEKERFVTFYFSGLRDVPFPLTDQHIIPSPYVATYDLKPEMSARELTQALVGYIQQKNYAFILVNFANPDMVGHTGNIEATIQAIKVVDECLGRIVPTALACDTVVIITADHGNAEQKINPSTGNISTEHTSNPVPCIIVAKEFLGKNSHLQTGILADVAPTVLGIMGIPKPAEMTGRNLLEELHATVRE